MGASALKGSLRLAAVISAVALSLALSGCTNRRLAAKNTAQSSLLNILGNASNYPIYVTQVVKSSLPDNTPIFQLVGANDGTIGSQCGLTSSGSATSGTPASPAPAQCVCSYTWANSDGSKQTLETPALYTEKNLLRCSYVGVPTNVASVQIQIRILAGSGGVSNPTDYSFIGTKGAGDPTNIANFARVRRYQCKKLLGPREGVSYAFDPGFYDPIEAEDIHKTDVLNFYTTNMGNTLTTFARSGVYGWYCPPNPVDDATGAASDTVNQMDMRLFSVNPLGGSSQIYPPVPGNDRYTFYLASQPTGVFNVPVDAYIAPKTMTSFDSSGQSTGLPPIGFAAAPVLVTVPGQSTPDETCPDVSTTPIPSGYKWVKVWLFRTTTPQKTIPVSQAFGHSIGAIGCNPGLWSTQVAAGPYTKTNPPWPNNVVEGCYSAQSGLGSLTPYSPADISAGNGTMLGRFLVYGTSNPGACFMTDPNQGAQIGSNPDPTLSGADTWLANDPTNDGFGTGKYLPPQYGCSKPGGSPYGDPLQTCSNMGVGLQSVLKDSNLVPQAIPAGDVNGSNYDFLFVVSDPSVTLNMMNQWSTVAEYTPFRFASPDDCPAGTPVDTCISNLRAANQLSYLITNYGLKLHAVNQLDNPGATGVGAFPVCAIQPK